MTTSNIKETIKSLSGTKAPGPNTTFTVSHIFYALELMAEKSIGRNKLAEKLNIGEGAIRTIINRLQQANIIVTSKEGCMLTEKGKKLWAEIESFFPKRFEVEKNELTNCDYNFAFLIRNCGHKIKTGIEQRDAAIMAGAKKAIAVVSKNGELKIESVSNNIEKEFPIIADKILKNINPQNNDVIVIVGSDTLFKAKRGAFAASWTLLNDA